MAPTHGPLLNYVTRVPLGVVAQITVSKYPKCEDNIHGFMQPFNHPLLIAVKKIAPALAAGNSVVGYVTKLYALVFDLDDST